MNIRKRERLGPNPMREVPVLFPETEIEVSPEEIDLYRQAGPFAFAIDRQSLHKEATRKGATGLTRRVDSIVRDAEFFNLYLPTPLPVPNSPEGTLPFIFDTNFWFVDGTTQRATGYAANQNARPRLWRAFLLARALAKHRCAPQAFLVGEASRFFRSEDWLNQFVSALWREGIKVHVSGFGDVTRETRPGLVAYINAISGWLGKVNEGARRIKKANQQIYHTNAPLGLRFEDQGARVVADPVTWPLLSELCRRLYTGDLSSGMAAICWLKTEHDIARSNVWLSQWLHSPIPDGIYDRAYSTTNVTRTLVQKGGLFSDLDITKGGNRRRHVTPAEGLQKRIEHTPATTPIPPEWVAGARLRTFSRRGRPPIIDQRPDVLVPFRILRCAHCGSGIKEKQRESGPWRLECGVVERLRHRLKCSGAAAAQSPEAQHCRHRAARASDAVWSCLWQAITTSPASPEEPDLNLQQEAATAAQRVTATRAAYTKFQNDVRDGKYGSEADEIDRTWIGQERERLKKLVRDAQGQADLFASRALTEGRSRASWQDVLNAFAEVQEADISLSLRKNIIERLIDRVELDLETGAFVMHGSLDVPWLQGLSGNLEIESAPWTTFNLPFLLQGSIAA